MRTHRMKTSPNDPTDCPSWYSSVFANCTSRASGGESCEVREGVEERTVSVAPLAFGTALDGLGRTWRFM